MNKIRAQALLDAAVAIRTFCDAEVAKEQVDWVYIQGLSDSVHLVNKMIAEETGVELA